MVCKQPFRPKTCVALGSAAVRRERWLVHPLAGAVAEGAGCDVGPPPPRRMESTVLLYITHMTCRHPQIPRNRCCNGRRRA